MKLLPLLPAACVAVSALMIDDPVLDTNSYHDLIARSRTYNDPGRNSHRSRPNNPGNSPLGPSRNQRHAAPLPQAGYRIYNPAAAAPGRAHGGRGGSYVNGNGQEIFYSVEDAPVLTRDQIQYDTGITQGNTALAPRTYRGNYADELETEDQQRRRIAIENSDPTPPRYLRLPAGDRLRTLRSSASPEEAARRRRLNEATERYGPRRVVVISSDSSDVSGDEDISFAEPAPQSNYGPRAALRPIYGQGQQGNQPLTPQEDAIQQRYYGNRRGLGYERGSSDSSIDWRKRNVVSSIINEEKKVSVGITNSTIDQAAEFQKYLAAYQTAQAQLSDRLFPLFDVVLNGTDSSLIYDLVWSVYSDLTGIGPVIIGPFSFGLNCLDWIEDQYFNSTNATTIGNSTDPATVNTLLTHQILLNIYTFVWTEATAIANEDSLLDEMSTLVQYLLPTNRSIATQDWLTPQHGFDDSYFTIYNQTGA